MEKGRRMGALTKVEGACYRVPKDCMKCAGEFYVCLRLIRCLAKKSLMKCVRKKFNRERVFVKGDIVDILPLPWDTMDTIEGDVWLIVNKSKKDLVTSWKRTFSDIKEYLTQIEVITKPYPIKEMAMIYNKPRHRPSDPMIESLSVYLDNDRYIYIDSTLFPVTSGCPDVSVPKDDVEENENENEEEVVVNEVIKRENTNTEDNDNNNDNDVITEVASNSFWEWPVN